MTAYEDLMKRFKEIVLIGTAAGILQWDLQSYMPPRAASFRGEQLASIGVLIHRLQTSAEAGELLSSAEAESHDADEVRARNLHLLRKSYDQETRLPEDLVADLARQQAITTDVWTRTKPKSDWKTFEPELKKLFDLAVRRCELLEEIKGVRTPYDASIDDFEPMMSSDQIATVFGELRPELVQMTKKYGQASKAVDPKAVLRKLSKDGQKALVEDAVNLIGYDTRSENAGGRLDEVMHAFTIGYYDDVRVTIHYKDDDPLGSVLTGMHEGGHALYEQNLNRDWMYQPLGASASSGIHESISRFYENMIGRSPEFWSFYLPRVNQLSSGLFSDVRSPDLLRALNRVVPSKIRITADEVTYSLHIIIRFEIEKALFDGKVEVSELPSIWNEKYESYLGVKIENDGEGVMQDMHWSNGYFGYFPSYALGNVYGGMWLEVLTSRLPSWKKGIAKGDMQVIRNWLTEQIFAKSNLYYPDELVSKVTGKKITAKPFLSYLRTKYDALFK